MGLDETLKRHQGTLPVVTNAAIGNIALGSLQDIHELQGPFQHESLDAAVVKVLRTAGPWTGVDRITVSLNIHNPGTKTVTRGLLKSALVRDGQGRSYACERVDSVGDGSRVRVAPGKTIEASLEFVVPSSQDVSDVELTGDNGWTPDVAVWSLDRPG